MTPKEIAEFAAEVYSEVRKARMPDAVSGQTKFFGTDHAFELTKIAVKAKLETAFAMSFDYSAD